MPISPKPLVEIDVVTTHFPKDMRGELNTYCKDLDGACDKSRAGRAMAIAFDALILVTVGAWLSDYALSYSAKAGIWSGSSYSDQRGGSSEQGIFALREERLGNETYGGRSLWTWRRQDKAAHTPPFRSVATPRERKDLAPAGDVARSCRPPAAVAGGESEPIQAAWGAA